MKKLRQFMCYSSNKIIERLVRDDQLNTKCKCGSMAIKQLSAPKCFSNTVGKSPSL